ncbi:MAG: hypothetical protein EON59_16315 [Alphaproteobacteria bacterium]|nr:MAG: hypothetical protein EON59_16315 [Alphaproteobacteria bacterium]
MLIITSPDKLDEDLLVAQMQGKFETRIVLGAGHVIHEDAPDKTAEGILHFISRHGLTKDGEAALLRAKLERARTATHGRIFSP